MLKDRQISIIPSKDSISVESNFENEKIWTFINVNIVSFPPYFQSIKDSDKENRISEFLIRHFMLCIFEQSNGYFPYYFGKNPTQPQSDRETDIGVFVSIRIASPSPIIEFEAKILSSKNSHNKEYVCGERGGIERFKRGLHSSHLTECGMFGYIQSNNADHWETKINNWINELSDKNTDTTIHWTRNEILQKLNPSSNVSKYYSRHQRSSSSEIVLYHYFIDLCSTVVENK